MSQSSQQQQPIMEADTMLDVYILDYLVKKKFDASTKAFEDEAKVPANVSAIDAPRGFLFEWWAVFWETFISRYKRYEEPYYEANRVLQQQQQQQQHQVRQHQSGGLNLNNAIIGKSPWIPEASAPMKQPISKQWHGDNVGTIMNPLNSTNHMPTERQMQAVLPTHDMNSLTNSLTNPSAQGSEGLSRGVHATGVLTNQMPLKGWPLTGLDQIQTQLHQQQGQLSYQRPIEGQLHPPSERKRKQPSMPVSVANNSATVNAIGIVSSSVRDVSTPNSPHNDKIDIDVFLNYGALDGNESSMSSHADKEPDANTSNEKVFTFLEFGGVQATSVNCCNISLDGKLVAIGGEDKKVRLWSPKSREIKATLDGHSQAITDICFSKSKLWLATCSLDRTVKIWDVKNLGCLIRTFDGHIKPVMSIDFHPKRDDFLCSCDDVDIRYWFIKKPGCVKATKGGANQVRFQPVVAKYLACAIGKSVSLVDLESTQGRKVVLKAHESNVQSICWDSSGEHLISVSEDYVKVWRVDFEGKADCIHELTYPGKRFHCGVFHPCYPSLLIIGCYGSMELWNMAENKMLMLVKEPVSALAVSNKAGSIVSAGHDDNTVKIWK